MSDRLLPDDADDRITAANTRPGDWVNPSPRNQYDLLVIGGGTAGLVAAGAGSLLGARVALLERQFTGGDCLIAGCVPSKALLRCARAAHEVRTAERFGVRSGELRVDFAAVMRHVRGSRGRISRADAARSFAAEYGVDLFFGNGRFTGRDSAAVDDTPLRFRRAIVATGSGPAVPPHSRSCRCRLFDERVRLQFEVVAATSRRRRRRTAGGASPHRRSPGSDRRSP